MPQFHDVDYIRMVEYILDRGVRKHNRTGVDTLSVFGYNMRFNLQDGTIPLLTTKKVHTKSIIHELLWFLAGDTNIAYLNKNGVSIWDEWAEVNGDLGPVYGAQWRTWKKYEVTPLYVDPTGKLPTLAYVKEEVIDQITTLINTLKTNPYDRRLIVDAWNVAELDKMALPPCHRSFQCYVNPLTNGQQELSMQMDQRSCDVGLGVPFNIAQYAILLRMLAQVTGMVPGELIWNGGDVHIYVNHIDQLTEQVYREPFPSPILELNTGCTQLDQFLYQDFIIKDYMHHPAIKMDVAV